MYCVNTLAGCCVDDGTGFSAQQSASPEAGRLSYERPSARPPSRPLHYSTSRIFITAGGCPKPQSDLQLINPWNRTTSVFSHRLRAASAGEGTERAGALAIIATLSCLLSALWGGGGGKGVGVHQKETGTMRAKEGIRPCILWAWRRGGGRRVYHHHRHYGLSRCRPESSTCCTLRGQSCVGGRDEVLVTFRGDCVVHVIVFHETLLSPTLPRRRVGGLGIGGEGGRLFPRGYLPCRSLR